MILTSKHEINWAHEGPQRNAKNAYLCATSYPDSSSVSYSYDALSRLTQVTDPSGAYSFTYDNLGRLLGTGTQYSFLSGTLSNSWSRVAQQAWTAAFAVRVSSSS